MAELSFNGLTFSYEPIPIDQAANLVQATKADKSKQRLEISSAFTSRAQGQQSNAVQSTASTKQ
ncbi:hypothetical protein Lepto7376_0303 [[Leptolyngbya] sp. PCC 7376]|uniref:hypothetical protein n=1 Tax=[Leptolyngbya] sp. PCC 7376 TaxID=111781 RepID=UPI00029EEE14|nr:hypothetical protein [[Leptolyngbya] sp. PCC 7376]AFY36745.1 hypothetical protein Lepto7376_0303 [[Leptolyngbya] sp. PCC 7376]